MKENWESEDDLADEMDFSKLRRVPNPFLQKFEDLHLVSLEDDVARMFSDSAAVNEALRQVMRERTEVSSVSPLAKAS